MVNKKVASWVILGTAILFALATARAFGSPTNNRPNSIGVEQFYMNKLTYTLALLLGGTINDEVTSIRLQPFGTPQLYDENLLLCGDVSDRFRGKNGVLILVYEWQSHRMYRGIGCHELKAVFEVKE
jgi:hypothetical protein